MKSLKIAALGVAALGFAALPVAGAFADNDAVTSHVDEINITVQPSCTLGSLTSGAYDNPTLADTDQTTHANGAYDDPKTTGTTETAGSWTQKSGGGITNPSATGVRTDVLSLNMQPGTYGPNIGSTTFTIRCNKADGYHLTAVANDVTDGALKSTTSDATIPAYDSSTAGGDVSYWNFALSLNESTKGNIEIAEGFNVAHAIPKAATTIASSDQAGNTTYGEVAGAKVGGEKVTVTYGAKIATDQESGTYTGSVTYTLIQGQ